MHMYQYGGIEFQYCTWFVNAEKNNTNVMPCRMQIFFKQQFYSQGRFEAVQTSWAGISSSAETLVEIDNYPNFNSYFNTDEPFALICPQRNPKKICTPMQTYKHTSKKQDANSIVPFHNPQPAHMLACGGGKNSKHIVPFIWFNHKVNSSTEHLTNCTDSSPKRWRKNTAQEPCFKHAYLCTGV